MTEPLPSPAATPPPRRWLRLLASLALLCFLATGIFLPVDANEAEQTLSEWYPLGEWMTRFLVAGPVALLLWSLWRIRRDRSDATLRWFRRLWLGVWLFALFGAAAAFIWLKDWQTFSGDSFRYTLGWLLAWTSGLLLIVFRPFQALARPAFWRALAVKSAFTLAALATLIALFYAEENWRGRHQWERFRAEWEAKGVKFTVAEVLPPPVPADENVAMHALFKPIFDYTRDTKSLWSDAVWRDTNAMQRLRQFTIYPDPIRRTFRGNYPSVTGTQERTNGLWVANFAEWQQFLRQDSNFATTAKAPTPAENVLRYLARHDALVSELDEALQRPRCRFPIRYDSEAPDRTFLPHLGTLKSIVSVLALRAAAAVEAEQPDAAIRDLERIYKVVALLDGDPFLITQLVRIATHSIATGAIAHGTVAHRWTEKNLLRLDALLAPINMLQAYEATIRPCAAAVSEIYAFQRQNRAALVELYAELAKEEMHPNVTESFTYQMDPDYARFVLRAAPAGWLYQLQTKEVGGLLQHENPTFLNSGQRRVTWGLRPQASTRLWFENGVWPMPRYEGSMTKAAAKSARIQTTLHHARIAVALERHWLRHRAYPERLDALVPEFLDRIPHDLFDGQPTRYRREGEQGFVLWSVGFDGKDDNAAPLLTKPSGTTYVGEETGDLVWRYPQSK